MENYITEFEKKITDISQNAENIYIVNAGVMNHGKSSLFNSILNREEFKTQDIRTTVQNQTAKWKNNVYLIDTPGIEAETKDDKEAYNAYKNANMILFVHHITTGELHKNELDAINKMKNIFDDKKYFWNHFCLTLTKWESETAQNIEEIKNKLIQDIKNYCNNEEELKIFLVSNTRYTKGYSENKQGLISKSGIPELREYLENNIEKWQKENKEVKNSIINREKKEVVNKIDKKYSEKIGNIQKTQKEFLGKCKDIVDEYQSDKSSIEQKINILRTEISNLKNEHQRDRSRY